jgi:hypothetical protein
MSKQSQNKNNLENLKKLTNDLCKESLENYYSLVKIQNIKQLLNAKNKTPETILQEINKIVNQDNE